MFYVIEVLLIFRMFLKYFYVHVTFLTNFTMNVTEDKNTLLMEIPSENVSSLQEELTRNLTHAVLPVTVFIGVEAFVGFFGNIFILLVYSLRYKMSNFKCFVLSLAIVDLTSCCTTLPGEIFSQLNWYTYEYDWICRVKSCFNIFTAWGSASILLILAYDRYRKISKPLAWQINYTLAIKLSIISFILSILMAIPILFLWGQQTYNYTQNGINITVKVCEKSSAHAHDLYPLIYIGCVYILPVSAMLFVAGTLNFRTARKLFGRKPTFFQKSKVSSSRSTVATVNSFSNLEETDLSSRTVALSAHLNNDHHAPCGSLSSGFLETNAENWLSNRSAFHFKDAVATSSNVQLNNGQLVPQTRSSACSLETNTENGLCYSSKSYLNDAFTTSSKIHLDNGLYLLPRNLSDISLQKYAESDWRVSSTIFSRSDATVQKTENVYLQDGCFTGSSLSQKRSKGSPHTDNSVTSMTYQAGCTSEICRNCMDLDTKQETDDVETILTSSDPTATDLQRKEVPIETSKRSASHATLSKIMAPKTNLSKRSNSFDAKMNIKNCNVDALNIAKNITGIVTPETKNVLCIIDVNSDNTDSDTESDVSSQFKTKLDDESGSNLQAVKSAREKSNKSYNSKLSKSCRPVKNSRIYFKTSCSQRKNQKTIIMIILTSVFIITMALYIGLSVLVAKPDSILLELSNTDKAIFFFFWRLYFLNSVVNTFLYGFLDPRFRKGLFSFCKRSD